MTAIILAAGSGTRMGIGSTKQRMLILGKSILRRCVEKFADADCIDAITVVVRSDEIEFAKQECFGIEKVKNIIIGGKNRAESARNGFLSVENETEYVMIHDACRCLVTTREISSVADAVCSFGAASAALKVVDTVKRCDKDGYIISTVPRDDLWAALTPQGFSAAGYRRALEAREIPDASVTDDNSLAELAGIPVVCVPAERTNIKITTAADIPLAEAIIFMQEKRNT